MAEDLTQSCDVLKIVVKIIGKKSVKINSGIYAHLLGSFESDDEDDFDQVHDIIIIKSKEGITIKDILKAFAKMQNQFLKINDSNMSGRSYFYEGIDYDKKTRTYNIIWGS